MIKCQETTFNYSEVCVFKCSRARDRVCVRGCTGECGFNCTLFTARCVLLLFLAELLLKENNDIIINVEC